MFIELNNFLNIFEGEGKFLVASLRGFQSFAKALNKEDQIFELYIGFNGRFLQYFAKPFEKCIKKQIESLGQSFLRTDQNMV